MDMNTLSKMLPIDPQSLERLSKSPDGQMLMALLQQKGGSSLDHATEAGKNGNYAEMTNLISDWQISCKTRSNIKKEAAAWRIWTADLTLY